MSLGGVELSSVCTLIIQLTNADGGLRVIRHLPEIIMGCVTAHVHAGRSCTSLGTFCPELPLFFPAFCLPHL